MAVKKGQFAKVQMQTGTDATTGDPIYTDVLKLREWSVSISSEKIDSTAAGDSWESHEIGHLSWEGEATCVDADMFWFAKLQEKVQIQFFDDAADVSPKFSGTASIDVERSTPYDDVIETSISFTGSGVLTNNA
jgi:hypothetical protein